MYPNHTKGHIFLEIILNSLFHTNPDAHKRQANLIQHLHLRAPHLEQNIERLLHGTGFGLSQTHACWQADKPQAIAVAEQTLSPQLRV